MRPGTRGRRKSGWRWIRCLGPIAVLASSGAGAGLGAGLEAAVETPATAWVWVEVGGGLPDAGQWRNGFDLADFDGDGRLDLVHGPPRAGAARPRLYRGTPRGGFEPWPEASFPDARYDYGDAAAGDLDGDGRADLVLAAHLGDVLVLRGEGDGHFARTQCCTGGEERDDYFSSRTVSIGDLDGDSRADIAALGEGPRPRGRGLGGSYGIRVWLNRGGGSWEARELQPSNGRLFGDSLELADLDGDGRLDLISGANVQGQRGVVFWGSGSTWEAGTLDALPEGGYLHAVAAADIGGSSAAEVAVAGSAAGRAGGEPYVAIVRWNRARVAELEKLGWSASDGRPTALAWGDPDGDDDLDLVVLNDSGRLAWFVNDHGELARNPTRSPDTSGCRGRSVRLADLDGDGRDEVIAGFADEGCPGGGSLRAWRLGAGPCGSSN